MTLSLFDERPDSTITLPAVIEDRPRRIAAGLTRGDHAFRATVRAIGIFVLLLTGSIGLFLGYQIFPTVHQYGFSFFTSAEFALQQNKIGIAAVLVGTLQVAVIALLIAFPLALLTALFITEYAPARLKPWAIGAVDLMAAIPSIIFGVWGLALLAPQSKFVARWLHQNLGWVPFFHVNADPDAADWTQAQYTNSAFIAGICVSMMVIPIATSVMRGVFAETPIGEREAAYALGSTKWGMIRTVVLPFGRGGIIGGTMLGLGRALGETIAVLLIVSPKFQIKLSVTETGADTVSGLIAGNFQDAKSNEMLRALLAAGFVLFAMTLLVNTLAAVVVNRSRSGANT